MSYSDLDYASVNVRIPDLELTYNKIHFKYDGEDLCHLKHSYASVEPYLPRTTRTPTGRRAKKQIKVFKQNVGWWRAQCVFRGLDNKGTIEEMQTRLKLDRNSTAPMIQELKDLEKKAKLQYNEKKNDAVHAWEVEAEATSRTMLQKLFPADNTSNGGIADQTVLEADANLQANRKLSEAAASLGLKSGIYYKESAMHWERKKNIVIARTTATVNKRLKQREDEKLEEMKRREYEHRMADMRELQKRVQENELAKKNHEQMVVKSGKGNNWDVTGTYKIRCPEIERNWPYAEDGLSLQIFHQQGGNGVQMYASFDFVVIKGVFRFENQEGDKNGAPKRSSKNTGDKRKRNYDDNNGEEDYDVYEYDGYGMSRRSPTPEEFYLGSTQKPSPEAAIWSYKWRGSDQGEGEICLYSDKDSYKLTFSGPGGMKLQGTFGGGAVGDCQFTGEKVSMEKESIDVRKEWAGRNERAWDRARVRRW